MVVGATGAIGSPARSISTRNTPSRWRSPAASTVLPAIGPRCFEVGTEVRDAFAARNPSANAAFVATGQDKWLCDIYLLARQRLERLGVSAISGGGACTHSESERYFSYRRDRTTGRMASLIWLDSV